MSVLISGTLSGSTLNNTAATGKPNVNTQCALGWYYIESANPAASVIINMFMRDDAVADATHFALDTDGATVAALLVDNGAIGFFQDLSPATTKGKWYHLAMQRLNATDFEWYIGDETTASVLAVSTTLGSMVNAAVADWVEALGHSAADATPNARVERWKHYNAVLTLAQIDAERTSLAPFSTTNLWSYNPLTVVTDLTGTQGSNPYDFTASGPGTFSTASGPAPVSGIIGNKVLIVTHH
jgi:hypothetical protein